MEDGNTFPQASLSEYYRGLRIVSEGHSADANDDRAAWLPVRSFDPECLVASDGANVLSRLAAHCDYVIAEDADLRPQDLIEHLESFSLRGLAVCDMTKAMGLTGNYSYVLRATSGQKPELEGERIW